MSRTNTDASSKPDFQLLKFTPKTPRLTIAEQQAQAVADKVFAALRGRDVRVIETADFCITTVLNTCARTRTVVHE